MVEFGVLEEKMKRKLKEVKKMVMLKVIIG